MTTIQPPVPVSASPTWDRYGRMKYCPDLHGKQKMPWTVADQKYLIENYDTLGPEQVSLALERTIHTIMTRVCKLRREGIMPPVPKKAYHKRMKPAVRTS